MNEFELLYSNICNVNLLLSSLHKKINHYVGKSVEFIDNNTFDHYLGKECRPKNIKIHTIYIKNDHIKCGLKVRYKSNAYEYIMDVSLNHIKIRD